MTLYGEERKRKRARARGLQALDKLLVVHRHLAALSHLSSSPPCHSVIRKTSTILCYLMQQMLLFVGSEGTYDTQKKMKWKRYVAHILVKVSWAVNPRHLQILRIDREGIIHVDDVIMHKTWRHLCKKTCEKDVVGIVTFVPDWFTSPPITILLILQWHAKVSEETFNVKS